MALWSLDLKSEKFLIISEIIVFCSLKFIELSCHQMRLFAFSPGIMKVVCSQGSGTAHNAPPHVQVSWGGGYFLPIAYPFHVCYCRLELHSGDRHLRCSPLWLIDGLRYAARHPKMSYPATNKSIVVESNSTVVLCGSITLRLLVIPKVTGCIL